MEQTFICISKQISRYLQCCLLKPHKLKEFSDRLELIRTLFEKTSTQWGTFSYNLIRSKIINNLSRSKFNQPQDHSFGTYAKFSEKQTFLPPDTHMYVCVRRRGTCAYQRVRNISFLENLANILHE